MSILRGAAKGSGVGHSASGDRTGIRHRSIARRAAGIEHNKWSRTEHSKSAASLPSPWGVTFPVLDRAGRRLPTAQHRIGKPSRRAELANG